MNTTTTVSAKPLDPATLMDVGHEEAVAFLRWCAQEANDQNSEADLSEEDRALMPMLRAGFDWAVQAIEAEPQHPGVWLLLVFLFDEGWDEYQDHLAQQAQAADV